MDQSESEHCRLRADHTPLLRRVSAVSDVRDDANAAARAEHQRLFMEIELESGKREERARALRLEQSAFAWNQRGSSLWAAVLSFRVSNGRRALEPFLVVWRTR
jgi:hypothetical protein